MGGSRCEQSSVDALGQLCVLGLGKWQVLWCESVGQVRLREWWAGVRTSEGVSRVDRLKPEMETLSSSCFGVVDKAKRILHLGYEWKVSFNFSQCPSPSADEHST